jgi:hypothetical protein
VGMTCSFSVGRRRLPDGLPSGVGRRPLTDIIFVWAWSFGNLDKVCGSFLRFQTGKICRLAKEEKFGDSGSWGISFRGRV